MLLPGTDTIFALATPVPSRQGSGIAIVRVSGPHAFDIAARLVSPSSCRKSFPERRFFVAEICHDGEVIDEAGVLAFRGPRSYTGEDVVEFHCHGGIAIVRALESALLSLGARPAEPGEFTRRAFLHGRLDLIQAESVAALVGAAGEAARREAIRQRTGALSERLKEIRASLHDLLGRIEVTFDYPEEGIDGTPSETAARIIGELTTSVRALLESFRRGQLLNGIRLAIIGRPNVGKSSLLNALLREDRAIVTPFPGTTRDVVSASLSFGGVPVELLDTAGIRAGVDEDSVEAEGIRRSWREVERAHLVLLVIDTSIPFTSEDLELARQTLERTRPVHAHVLLVCNKIDLKPAFDLSRAGALLGVPDLPSVLVSAKTGQGIEDLADAVVAMLELERTSDEIVLTQTRHKALLEEVESTLSRAEHDLIHGTPQDIVATELWGADRALARLLGENIAGADLDEIFGRFCIGK